MTVDSLFFEAGTSETPTFLQRGEQGSGSTSCPRQDLWIYSFTSSRRTIRNPQEICCGRPRTNDTSTLYPAGPWLNYVLLSFCFILSCFGLLSVFIVGLRHIGLCLTFINSFPYPQYFISFSTQNKKIRVLLWYNRAAALRGSSLFSQGIWSRSKLPAHLLWKNRECRHTRLSWSRRSWRRSRGRIGPSPIGFGWGRITPSATTPSAATGAVPSSASKFLEPCLSILFEFMLFFVM